MNNVFLSAEWRKLAMANYIVDVGTLTPFLPAHTEIDTFNGKCFVSLVGFMFVHTKVRGFSIPFHRTFEEVNLRFYVRYRTDSGWRRGVVFVKEIVPRSAITLVANALYQEHYQTLPMNHEWICKVDSLTVAYRWKQQDWHSIAVTSSPKAVSIQDGSEAEFITEHFWGYTRINDNVTSQYEVQHPRWEIYPVNGYSVEADFGLLYGDSFAVLNQRKPDSVFLAEGSPIKVFKGTKISRPTVVPTLPVMP